jgi:hypothetical protein
MLIDKFIPSADLQMYFNTGISLEDSQEVTDVIEFRSKIQP